MLRFIIRRIGYSVLVLLGVVTLVFVLFNVLPSDPARMMMGQRSDIATVEQVRKQMNLDKSLPVRYVLYLNDISPLAIHDKSEQQKYEYVSLLPLSENRLVLKWPYLGRSYQTKKKINDILAEALPGTIILALTAIFFATILGIFFGVLAALKKDTLLDTSAIAVSVAGISTPSFFAGLIIAYVFGYLLHSITGLNMTGSLWEYDVFGGKHLALQNLILPAIALGVRPMAIITQLTRSSLLDVLSQDYIRTAYAKGLSTSKVVWRHALPNAMNPVITAVSGWLAELLAGSFFIEYIFGWKGIGKLAVSALDTFDFPLVMGAVLVTAFMFIIINLLTDILYSWLDPRISYT